MTDHPIPDPTPKARTPMAANTGKIQLAHPRPIGDDDKLTTMTFGGVTVHFIGDEAVAVDVDPSWTLRIVGAKSGTADD